jgi:pSer/pThr/pTyr-binding forkhead associated (FHA) protein
MDRPEAADAMVASLLAARRREEIERSQTLAVIAPKSVRLVPLDQGVIDQLGPAPLMIEEFPFVIGRDGDSARTGVALSVSLTLVDKPPFHLSRRHFSIDHKDGHYIVQDCRSYHGTIVNGEPLGAGTATYQAQLHPGENEIVAGVEDSPFRFTCVVPITPTG